MLCYYTGSMLIMKWMVNGEFTYHDIKSTKRSYFIKEMTPTIPLEGITLQDYETNDAIP